MAAQEGAAGTTNQVERVRYGDVDDSNFALRGSALGLPCAAFDHQSSTSPHPAHGVRGWASCY